MLEILKKLFNLFQSPSFGMGALPSPEDLRNIPINRIQSAVATIPDAYLTDLSAFGVNDQGTKPTCVGQSISKIAEYYVFRKTGKIVKFDAEKLYNQCKLEDGIPDLQGTYADIAIKIIIRDGIDQYDIDSNDKVATGYAFVPYDFYSVCNAIYQNGVVTFGLMIDKNWFKGIIGKALSFIGGHQVILNGYSMPENRIYGLNSWGIGWIGRIAGLFDPKVKQGFFFANFNDIKDYLLNVIAILPIPKEIIDDAHNTPYTFTKTMKFGSTGAEVKRLQEFLGIKPADGWFGKITQKAVIAFQVSNGLTGDGIVGTKTLEKLNKPAFMMTPLELAIMKVESEGNLYAIGDKHLKDKAFGPMQIRRPCVEDVNNALVKKMKAEECLGNLNLSVFIFREYQKIYNPNGTDEEKSRTWNGGSGWKKKPYLTDGYWEKVKKLL